MPDENTRSQEQLAGTNESEAEDSQENIPGNFDHQAIMIIRFSDVCLKEFRTNLKQNRDMLVENGGELIALAPQVKELKQAHHFTCTFVFKTLKHVNLLIFIRSQQILICLHITSNVFIIFFNFIQAIQRTFWSMLFL
jgi:hypothetical protein